MLKNSDLFRMFFRKIFNCVSIASTCRVPFHKIVNNTLKFNLSTMSGFQNAKESLAAVRSVLLENKVDAFIVGSGDAHQSEYVCDRDMRRQFVSKFNGSAGTALILQNAAYLWTDGRYFLQASSELSDDWILMKSGEPKVLELADWVVENLSAGQSVGIDATLITTSQATAMKNLFGAKGISLVSLEQNPVDIVWSKANQPAAPSSAINVHGEDRSGVSHQSKILSLQAFVREAKASAIVISMLDEVVWLFNIRGSDVDFNPVVIGYAVVTLDKAYLFVDPTKVTSAVNEHFGDAVEVRPYEEVESFLAQLALSGPVVADPSQLNWRLYQALGSSVVDRVSPVALAKSVKNDVELNGIRQAHIRDGAALTAFIHWLETTVKRSPESLTEVDAMDMLEEFRGRVKDHKGPSFPTIAGYGPNGAIIHYHAEKHNTSQIGVNSLFLLDSGGQYLDGTTDVTRTMHFGVPTQRMKDAYTAVLKGHIAFASLVFPAGTVGSRFDCVARLALWDLGLDYNHGTGHGVGAFLNVHEGPQGVGFRKRDNEAGFAAGMTISNEPGYYENGAFGVRIENVCITVPVATPNNFNDKQYLGFETVTMTPIKLDLVNLEQLSAKEVAWVNAYHLQVRRALTVGVAEHFPEALAYLVEQTQPIGEGSAV